MAKVKLTLREYIHFLNAEKEDRDLYVDYVHDSIAVCGGEIGLTPCGFHQWGDVLDLEVEEGCVIGTAEQCNKAWGFLCSLAGYCALSGYKAWFEGDAVKYI